MKKSLEERDAVLRARFMREGMPYLSYRTGEIRHGIFRIGKWTEKTTVTDPKTKKATTHTSRRTVTPKQAYKIVWTFRREWWTSAFHLWIEPLPPEEQAQWKEAFAAMDVVYDKAMEVSA